LFSQFSFFLLFLAPLFPSISYSFIHSFTLHPSYSPRFVPRVW
jgi:hypothetical protein